MLSGRALNRAALERQMLLRRHPLTVVEATARLVGLNAQSPNPPYVSLWARLAGFTHDRLTAAIEGRRVVRSTLVRATQHLVARDDYPWLRAVLTPLLVRVQRNVFGRRIGRADPDELVAAARSHLAGGTLTRPQLARLLEQRWPDAERGALAWSVQYLEPVLHPAPSGTWDTLGATPFVLASDWYGDAAEPGPDPARRLVRRYLAGYGPALVGDVRAWSGVAGLPEVVAGMGDELRTFRDAAGRELIDLPEAPRPDPDVPAPVRFLPEFDDLLLAYGDRTRVMTDDVRARVCVGDAVAPTVLVDGTVRATWALDRASDRRKRRRRGGPADDGTTTLTVSPFAPLSSAEADAVTAEGALLLAFAAPGEDPADIRILRPP